MIGLTGVCCLWLLNLGGLVDIAEKEFGPPTWQFQRPELIGHLQTTRGVVRMDHRQVSPGEPVSFRFSVTAGDFGSDAHLHCAVSGLTDIDPHDVTIHTRWTSVSGQQHHTYLPSEGVTRYYEDEVSEPGEYTISLEDNALFVTPTVSLSLTLDCWDMPLVRRNIGIGSFADGVREIRRLLIGESGSANPPGQQSRHPA